MPLNITGAGKGQPRFPHQPSQEASQNSTFYDISVVQAGLLRVDFEPFQIHSLLISLIHIALVVLHKCSRRIIATGGGGFAGSAENHI